MRHVEAGGTHQHIDRPFAAIGGDDAVRGDALDALGHQLDVRSAQGGVEVVGVDDAFAAQRVGRRELLAQAVVPNLPLAVRCRRGQQPAPRQRAVLEAATPPFEHLRPIPAHERGIRWQVRQRPIEHGVAAVDAGHHPVRGALEQVQLLRLRGDRGHQLRGGRSGADHGDPLALQLGAVVPARGVQPLALEVIQTGDVGPARPAQRPGAAHEEARAQHIAAVGSNAPMAGGCVEGGLGDLRAQPQMRQQPEASRHALHVGLDLGRAGEAPGPVGVGCEGVGIGRRRHIDVCAGVGVVPPGATQPGLLLQDHEVVDARALELDARTQARHACAEDHHLVIGGARGRVCADCRECGHRETCDALNRLVGTAQHAAMGLEHMPSSGGDFTARVDAGGLQRGFQLQRLTLQQLVGTGLDQRGWQPAQIGKKR